MKRFVSMKMFEFETQTPVKRFKFETMTPTKSFKTPRRFESMKRFETLTPMKSFETTRRFESMKQSNGFTMPMMRFEPMSEVLRP